MSRNVVNVDVQGQGLKRVTTLERKIAIGFSGSILDGLKCARSSTGQPLVCHPLGSTVVVRHVAEGGRQSFLTGHTYLISCMDLKGGLLVTGEEHQIGTKVEVIIWSLKSLAEVGRYKLHHASVKAVCVADDESLVVSAGGRDDSTYVVWSAQNQAPMCVGRKTCGRPFSASCLSFLPGRCDSFVAGGQDALQVWTVDTTRQRMDSELVSLGKLKRSIKNVAVCREEFGDFIYCGTESGDIVKLLVTATQNGQVALNLVACAVKRTPKSRRNGAMQTPGNGLNQGKFAGGVCCLLQVKSEELLVGSGDGTLALVHDKSLDVPWKPGKNQGTPKIVSEPTKSCLRETKSVQLSGGVSSLTRLDEGTVLVGCTSGETFQLDLLTFGVVRLSSCHTSEVKDAVFPRDLDEILATCGSDGIRVWNLTHGDQIFHVSQADAHCIIFTPTGNAVIAGFQDGCIRAYTPQTGKGIYQAQGAHPSGVTALCHTRFGLLSGGQDGQIRTWRCSGYATPGKPGLLATLREHKQQITSLQVTQDESEAISASSDGSCIVWNLQNPSAPQRKRILHGTAALLSAKYHPSESQILTLAIDGQLSYWEVLTGQEIRSINVGKHGAISALGISPDGEKVTIGGSESIAKIWRYRQGDLAQLGHARCGPVSRVCVSPKQSTLVATTEHGGIIAWEMIPS